MKTKILSPKCILPPHTLQLGCGLYGSTARSCLFSQPLQNRRQKVFSMGTLDFCGGPGILKIEKNSTNL